MFRRPNDTCSLRWCVRSMLLWLLPGRLGQILYVAAAVFRPSLAQLQESCMVACIQGASGFFVVGCISQQRAHNGIGGFLGLAAPCMRRALFAGLLDEFAQGDRGPALLLGQPVPVPGKQRHLSSDYAQLWPAYAARRPVFLSVFQYYPGIN